MALFRDAADVSVRPATPEDDAAVAAVQLRAWRATHEATLGAPVLDALDGDAVRAQWSQAITAPPSPQHRVLVALDGPRVVGFAASVPAGDAVEIVALEVDPDARQAGHGSRLLAACVDLARETGAARVRTWVLAGDTGRERFLTSAGLGPEGRRRTLGLPTGEPGADAAAAVVEERWSAEI